MYRNHLAFDLFCPKPFEDVQLVDRTMFMVQDLSNVENLYETIASEYAEVYAGEHDKKPKNQEILHRFSREIMERRPVWGFGCGPGRTINYLKNLLLKSQAWIYRNKYWNR